MAAATSRKLVVEVCEAHDLLPKDGHGTSSAYAVVDFRGQRRRTRTVRSDLNPVWSDALHFLIDEAPDDDSPLEVEIFHDRRVAPTRRSNFLGRVRLGPSHFVRQGEEALVFFPLESRGWFSWVRGDIGLRIYYLDEEAVAAQPPPAADPPPPPPEINQQAEPPPATDEKTPETTEEAPPPPPANATDDPRPPPPEADPCPKPPEPAEPPPPPPPPPEIKEAIAKPAEPVVIRQTHAAATSFVHRRPALHRPGSEMYDAGSVQERPVPRATACDLVEKMQYLFVRIVKARSLPVVTSDDLAPVVKLAVSSGKEVRSEPGRRSISGAAAAYEWGQTFAFGGSALESAATLEVSVWSPPLGDGGGGGFLGGVCFDVSDVPARDQADSPLAPLWYRLEGGGAHRGGDLMLATWIGTQADESFADAWKTDAGGTEASRAKVYVSPKLWYLRAAVIEAQDLTSPLGSPTPGISTEAGFCVRAELGFQILKTRTATNSTGTPVWNEDLLLVASEPFAESRLLFSVETRSGKEKSVLGTAEIPLSSIERRVDDRKVVSRWVDLSMPMPTSSTHGDKDDEYLKLGYAGRLHIRVCFDGGYHVMDECGYPLLVLLPGCVKRMGEMEVGVRFTRSTPAMDMLQVYTRPILPRMHYSRPIGVAQQELLRGVASRITAVHLARSEPPLPREVALYLLDADSQGFSMRKVRANWARIVGVLSGPIRLLRWLEDIRAWKNPTATLMVHALLILLVCHPDLLAPTLAAYVFAVGVWNYRGRARGPSTRLWGGAAQVDQAVDRDELDEEFDTVPSSRPGEVARARYDRLRAMGARVQAVLGDLAAQGERVQALVTWQDPRATFMFVGTCLLLALCLYVVPAKMAAVAAGCYYFRHPMFRDRMPPPVLNFFRRLPTLGDRML